jgi:hypothetical protein
MSVQEQTINVLGSEFYTLYLDYDQNAPDASRVFRTLADLVDAVRLLDEDLAHAIFDGLSVSQRLRAIDAGSIDAWIESLLQYAEGSWTPSIPGASVLRFVVRAREALLSYIGSHETVVNAADAGALRHQIVGIAQSTGVTNVLSFNAPSQRVILHTMKRIGDAKAGLRANDRVEYRSDHSIVSLSARFQLTSDQIDDLVTAETQSTRKRFTLVVRRPDYLGSAMWQFRYGGKNLDARMEDTVWLARFQSGQVELRPGDSILAEVEGLLKLADDGDLVTERYAVKRVIQVIRADGARQSTLPFKDVA